MASESIFPIPPPYRDILLPMEVIMISIAIEIAFFFFLKYWRNKKNSVPSMIEFDWAVIFASFGLMFTFYIVSDYFALNRGFFLLFGYMSFAIGGLLFAFHVELTRITNTKYIFTIIVVFIIGLILFTAFFIPDLVRIIGNLCFFPVIIILIIYLRKLTKTIRSYYRFFWIGFAGIFILFFGYLGTTDEVIRTFTLYARVISDIFIIGGMVMVGFFVNLMPKTLEIGWDKKIKYIILIDEASGICMYNENFQEKTEINEVLLSGALASIQIFLGEAMTSKKKVKVISQKDDVFIIEHGKRVMGVLIAEQELEILKYHLSQLVKEFEVFFHITMDDWRGDTGLFLPTKNIIKRIFST